MYVSYYILILIKGYAFVSVHDHITERYLKTVEQRRCLLFVFEHILHFFLQPVKRLTIECHPGYLLCFLEHKAAAVVPRMIYPVFNASGLYRRYQVLHIF